jgi:hypothetical protein
MYPAFLVCPSWNINFYPAKQLYSFLIESCVADVYFSLGSLLAECILESAIEDFPYVVNHAVE